jgi:hypothetical protein
MLNVVLMDLGSGTDHCSDPADNSGCLLCRLQGVRSCRRLQIGLFFVLSYVYALPV